jgi:hypothetical protein
MPLGVNWLSRFLKRFLTLQSRFIPPIDKERYNAQDLVIISDWFELYCNIKAKYSIADVDTWNMDSVGNNIKYKCTDCTDYSPSFLTQTDHGPYPN